MDIGEFLDKLADLILQEIAGRGCSQECFAGLCGLSRNEIGRIIQRSKKDISISTVLKIVENSNITYKDLFVSGKSEDF